MVAVNQAWSSVKGSVSLRRRCGGAALAADQAPLARRRRNLPWSSMTRVVIITGASSGIGQAAALALAPSSRLLLVARRADRLAALRDQVRAAGGQAEACACDLSAAGAGAPIIASALACFGAIDALVNNAGCYETAAVDALDEAHAERLWRLNVLSPMLLARAAIPVLARSPTATIITVSSVASDAAFAGSAVYAGSKAAIEAWSRVAREELRAQGIRVGVIVPGATATAVWGATMPVARERMCQPEDVAAAIRFMLDAPPSASVDRLVITPPGGPF